MPDQNAESPAKDTPRHILILDDDEMFQSLAAALCAEVGLTPHIAQGPADFQAAARDNPEFVMVDLMMPGIDGVQVLSYIADHELSSKVILVSSAEPRLLQACKAFADMAGVPIIGVLSKPFWVEELKELIESDDAREDHSHPAKTLPERTVEKLIAGNHVQMQYQPKVDLVSGRVSGVEALARLVNPKNGQLITPDRFIHAAERPRLVEPFTRRIVDQVMVHLRMWNKDTAQHLRAAVNLPMRVLETETLPDWIRARARHHEITPDQLQFEITEHSVAGKFMTVLKVALRLRLASVGISIDDFGFGFSSEERLRQLPSTELKIDASLIAQLPHPKAKARIQEAVALARDLKVDVVAEGVETPEQAGLAANLGCDQAQGFYYAKPMNHYEVTGWIAEFEAKGKRV